MIRCSETDLGMTMNPYISVFGPEPLIQELKRKYSRAEDPTSGRSELGISLVTLRPSGSKGDQTSSLVPMVPTPDVSALPSLSLSKAHLEHDAIILTDLDNIRMSHKRM